MAGILHRILYNDIPHHKICHEEAVSLVLRISNKLVYIEKSLPANSYSE
jgi:hypothetical protein